MKKDTIAAIATAMSNSGIGIVRISGAESFEIIQKIYRGKTEKTYRSRKAIRFITVILRMEKRLSTKCS